MSNYILEIENLSLSYMHINVVNNINFSVNKGEVYGIVGESGSGKSTILKAIIDPSEYGISINKGIIKYKGQNMSEFSKKEYDQLKGTNIMLITQNPYDNFNPIRSYYKQFLETLKSHNMWQGQKTVQKILKIFRELGFLDGDKILKSCPYELSGGMNQRMSIALSIILKPELVLADEPTSALDVVNSFQVIEQLKYLSDKYKVSIILVSHNLSVITRICDSVAIMNNGNILESGNTRNILLNPKNSYTKELINAIPTIKI